MSHLQNESRFKIVWGKNRHSSILEEICNSRFSLLQCLAVTLAMISRLLPLDSMSMIFWMDCCGFACCTWCQPSNFGERWPCTDSKYLYGIYVYCTISINSAIPCPTLFFLTPDSEINFLRFFKNMGKSHVQVGWINWIGIVLCSVYGAL